MTEEQKVESYKDTLLRIQKLNSSQKVLLAQNGTPAERRILAKSSAMNVLLAIVNSPKATESEIEHIAGQASTPEPVLQAICSSPRWKRSSRIRLACLKNPRLPASVSNRFLSGFSPYQLRSIAKDPVMPGTVREGAKRTLATKRGR